MRGNSNRFIAEYEQRINNNVKLFIDATFNGSIDSQDFTYAFEEDSVFSIKLAMYFYTRISLLFILLKESWSKFKYFFSSPEAK